MAGSNLWPMPMLRNTGIHVHGGGAALIWVKASQGGSLADCVAATDRGRNLMSAFTVRPLTRDQILSVFPLIREAMPDVELGDWTGFARRITGRRGANAGIMAAWREGRSFPCGLFCYRVDKTLAEGKVLVAEHFVAVDLLEPKAVLAALVAELEALGRRLECNALRSVVHGDEREVAGGLVAAGHAPDASLLLKALANKSERRRPAPLVSTC